MSDERLEKLETSVQTLRKVTRDHEAAFGELRWAVLAAAVAGSMLALTSATWRTTAYEEEIMEVSSLWGLAPRGFLAGLTLTLVVVVAVASVGVFFADVAGPKPHVVLAVLALAHVVLAVLALVTVVPILFVGTVENETPYRWAVDEPGAGRWLTLVAALVLAVMHASRAGRLRGR
jgi:hypothetical protein